MFLQGAVAMILKKRDDIYRQGLETAFDSMLKLMTLMFCIVVRPTFL